MSRAKGPSVAITTDSTVIARYESAPAVDIVTPGDVSNGASLPTDVSVVIVDGVRLENGPEIVRTLRAADQQVPLAYVCTPTDREGLHEAVDAGVSEIYLESPGATDTPESRDTFIERIEATRTAERETAGDRSPKTTATDDETTAKNQPNHRSRANSQPDHRTREKTLERLYSVITATDRSFEARLETLLEETRLVLGVEYGALSNIEDDTYRLEIVGGADERVHEGAELPLSQTYCERIAATGESLAFTSVSEEQPTLTDRAAFTDLELHCFAGTPVFVDGEVWGTLCFFDGQPAPTSFTTWEQTLIDVIANWVSHELEHRAQQRELETARTELEQTLERMDDAFFALDESWTFTYINEKAHDLINPAGRTLLGHNVWEAFPEAIGETFEDGYRQALEEQTTVTFEEYFPPLETWFEVRAYPSQTGLSVFFTDVTERKRRDRELQRYERVVETVDDGVFVIDTDQRFVFVNDAYAELTGYDVSTLVGSDASQVVDETTWESWLETVGDLQAGRRESATIETSLVRADGIELAIEAQATVIREDGSITGYACIVRDVSERRRRERTIRDVLEANRALFACETTGEVARTIIETGTEMFGFDFASVRRYDDESDSLVLEAATDELRSQAAERGPVDVEESLLGKAFTEDEAVIIEDVRTDSPHDYGTLRSAMCLPMGGAGVLAIGSPTVGAFDEADVDLARLLAESGAAALRRANRRETLLRHEQVLETVKGMVYAVDEDARFTLVTEPFAARLGYSRTDLIGERATVAFDPDESEQWQTAFEASQEASTRESQTLEVSCQTADGRTFPVEIELSALPGADDVAGAVGAVHDITERKERERYLQVLNRVLRHNLRNDLTVVIGYADHLANEIDEDELAAVAHTLSDMATDLADLSEDAKEIERVLRLETAKTTDVSIEDVVTRAVEAADGTERADLEVDLLANLSVTADTNLATALEELLENAIEHTSGTDPCVRVSARTADTHAIIAVEDDGPGIPMHEQEIITGDEDITQLSHGSGLGLWLVRWIVESYEGQIRFADTPLGGTRVELHLERAESTKSVSNAEGSA